jgi:hypothetical protein
MLGFLAACIGRAVSSGRVTSPSKPEPWFRQDERRGDAREMSDGRSGTSASGRTTGVADPAGHRARRVRSATQLGILGGVHRARCPLGSSAVPRRSLGHGSVKTSDEGDAREMSDERHLGHDRTTGVAPDPAGHRARGVRSATQLGILGGVHRARCQHWSSASPSRPGPRSAKTSEEGDARS